MGFSLCRLTLSNFHCLFSAWSSVGTYSMHSDIRNIFIIAKRIQLVLVFISLIFLANYSFAAKGSPTPDCLGGYWAEVNGVSCPTVFSDCPGSLYSYLDVEYQSHNGTTFPAPTYLKKLNSTSYGISISEVCLQDGQDRPDDDDDKDDDGCPDNQFWANGSGQCSDADDCLIGTSLSAGSCSPDDCSAGYYFNNSSQSCSPIPCPDGQTRVGSACVICDPDPDPDPDPDNGGGDSGGGGDSSGGGGSTPTCDTYSSCRDIALDELSCKENDRDRFIYQYIGPDDYAAECETCDGPEYLLYAECQSGACQYGYDSQNNRCWSISCPHGDCLDPEGDGAFDPDPLPTNQDNSDERLSEIITAINSVRDSIEANEAPQKIEALSQDLTNKLETNKQAIVDQLENNQDSNTSDNQSIIELLESISLDVDSNNGTAKDYTDLLNRLLDNSDDLLCQINPKRAGCDSFEQIQVDHISPSHRIIDGIENSGIYSALSDFNNISINVTSACPSSFRFQITFMGTYYVDVCSVFDPIVPLIRALFIGFWGLVSFRALTDA